MANEHTSGYSCTLYVHIRKNLFDRFFSELKRTIMFFFSFFRRFYTYENKHFFYYSKRICFEI